MRFQIIAEQSDEVLRIADAFGARLDALGHEQSAADVDAVIMCGAPASVTGIRDLKIDLPRFLVTAWDDGFRVNASPPGRIIRAIRVEGLDGLMHSFDLWLDELASGSLGRSDQDVRELIEAFVRLWHALEEHEHVVPPPDRRTAEAFVRMAMESVEGDTPPVRSVLRPTFRWLLAKMDAFADEFAGAAGKATGTTAGIGMGAAATGQLPKLLRAAGHVLDAL